MRAFFHNIGQPSQGSMQSLWDSLRKHEVITAGFGNELGGRGTIVLQRYQRGDDIFAYVNGFGVVGYGIAKGPQTYRLIDAARHGTNHRQEVGVSWQLVAIDLNDAIGSAELRALTCHLPRQTSERLNQTGADRLLAELTSRWASDAVLGEEGIPDTYPEGSVVSRLVNAFERNREARAACIAFHGTSCLVCNFNFQREYGSLGHGIIHVHHLVPLSQIGEAYRVSPIDDLRPVCPNCHAMLHMRRSNPYSIEELREMMESARQARPTAV